MGSLLLRSVPLVGFGLLVAGPVGWALGHGAVTVEYSYVGPSSLLGEFHGSCAASGAYLPAGHAGALEFDSAGGELLRRWTRVNSTILSPETDPKRIDEPDGHWAQPLDVPAGHVRVAWPADGALTIYEDRPGRDTAGPLRFDLDATRISALPLRAGVDPPAASFYDVNDAGEIVVRIASFPGWNREIDADGGALGRGTVVLYLREASVAFDGAAVALAGYSTTEFEAATPLVVRRTVVYEDAFLELRDARFSLPPDARLLCHDLAGAFHGAYSAASASGYARAPAETITFDDRVLSLEGDFVLAERGRDLPPDPGRQGRVDAQARGDIAVVGLDFAAVSEPASPGTVAAAGLVAVLVAALVWAGLHAGSLVGFFYSRFSRDQILDHPARDTIYQAVRANPGLDLTALTRLTSFHLTTVAYHVQVLHRVGLVGTVRQGKSRRVLPTDMLTQDSARDLAVQQDARLAFVVSQVRAGPRSLRELSDALARHYGITRRAAYMHVCRAEAASLVERLQREGRTVIRCRS